MNFDPMTGEPIKRNFDPMTGEPINHEQTPEAPVIPEAQGAPATPETQEAPVMAETPAEELINNTAEQQPEMRFDSVTGQPAGVQPEMRFDPMTGQPAGMPPKKRGFFKSTAFKVVLAIAIVVVVACGAAAFAFSNIFASDSDKVLNAMKKTFEEKGELAQAFEVGDIIKSDEYTLGFSMNAQGVGVDLSYLVGKAGKQVNGAVNIAFFTNIDFAMNLTEEELQVQIPYISDKLFTYNYKGENAGYLMEEMSSDEIEAINKSLEYLYNSKSNTDAFGALKDAILEEYNNLDFEQVADAEFEVDGKDRTCEGYETVITAENFQNIIDAYEEATSEEIDEMEALMKDLSPSYVVGSYADTYDELRNELEDMPDVTVTFYIYDGKLACVELQPEDDIAVQIQFLGGDRRSQNIRVIDEDGYVAFELVGGTDGSVESYELISDDISILSIEYDSKSGDFSLYSDEVTIRGSIESDRDGFTINIDELVDEYDDSDFEGSIFLKKGADFQEMEGDKFDIGNASEDEVTDLMTEINDNLY